MKKRLLKISLLAVLAIVVLAGVGLTYVKLALPNVGPAPEITIQSTPERIEHGRYLALHVASCIDCHSARDFSKLAGPMVPGTDGKGGEMFTPEMGFPGTFYSPNLTPDHLGEWSDGELFRAITTGVSRDGHALFPVMPYLTFGKMDPEDIKDIIAYLRTLEPIKNTVAVSQPEFPMNFILNTIPAKGEGSKRPDTTDQLAYGKYVTTFASCIECHTQVDAQGQLVPGMEFAGGREFPMPSGTVRSMNITPDKSGIGSWTKEQFIARFKSHVDPKTPAVSVAEEGFNTIMPWTMLGGMNENDLGAIYDYLRTIKPVVNKVERFTPKPKLVASR